MHALVGLLEIPRPILDSRSDSSSVNQVEPLQIESTPIQVTVFHEESAIGGYSEQGIQYQSKTLHFTNIGLTLLVE